MNDRVIVYTRAYNTQPYIKQCIESVLSQTHSNFEYILVDNGCTDGSSQIMREYAAQDKRIQLIRYEQNSRIRTGELVQKYGTGSYVTILDSDDWWEPNYLERLLNLAKATQADIVSTGTLMHLEENGQTRTRRLEQMLMLRKSQYAEAFPRYHVFFRTTWGKLIRTELYLQSGVLPEKLKALKISYGADTISAFSCLRQSKQICLDNSALYHYRIHRKSISYKYNAGRFKGDVYLYNDAIDFLSAYGPISAQNRNFLQAVYSNAVIDTTDVIHNSTLSPAEKLREYRTIAVHPLTQTAYKECTDPCANQSREQVIRLAILAGTKLGGEDDTDFCAVMQSLLPQCGRAVTKQNLPLFCRNDALLHILLRDDLEQLLAQLLTLIVENRYVKKYDLPGAVKALAADRPLLCQIEDAIFLRNYAALYQTIWKGETLRALEEMTGLLLEDKVNGGKKTFLRLYISLAALEGQAPAFLFGKMQLAWLCLRQGQREECQAVADELAEMGMESDELSALRRALEENA